MTVRATTPAFVGRSAELAALVDAFGRAAAGRGATALVGGEAGVGKSRLVAEMGAQARRRGARVLVGQCLDLESGGLPYAPIVDVLRTLARELSPEEGAATLGPVLALLGRGPAAGDGGADAGDVDGEPATEGTANVLGQARLFELLLTVIERLVEAGPLVLVVEDVHWADRSTLDLVSLLASNTRELPVLLVATYRSEDVPPRHPLRDLSAELTRRGALHLPLDRLGPGDVAELLGALLATAPPAEVTASVVARTDGNPLFIEELAAAVAEDPEAPMPPQLRDAVITRVEHMPPEAAAVLRACAVGGRQVEHDLLAAVLAPGSDPPTTPVDPLALDRALRTCVDHRLLVSDQRTGSYRFRHALVHEAVLDDTLPGELARLHAAYAAALAASGRDDDRDWARLAHHWAAAADYDAALGAAVRAGRAAESAFAVPEAHRYLEWSVRLWDRAADPEAAAGCDRGRLLAWAADAASRGGAVLRALTLVDEALATPQVTGDPVRAGLLHERRGWYLHRSGRQDEALAAYELAVSLVPAAPASAARARVVQNQAHALVRAGRHDEAGRWAEDALALAREVGDVPDEGQARHVLGLVMAADGRTDEALATLLEAGRIAGRIGDLPEVAGAYLHLWRTLVEAGRGPELPALLAALGGAAPASEGGAPSLLGIIGAGALQLLGRWDEADRLLGDARAAQEAGGLTAVARTLVAGSLAVDRGDHDAARDQLEIARTWCHQVGDGRLNGLLHRSLAELAAWQGRWDDARREVDAGLTLLAYTGDPELAARIAAVGVRIEADRADASRRAGGRGGSRPGPDEREADRRADGLVRELELLADTARMRHAPAATEVGAALATGRGEAARLTGAPDPGVWRAAAGTWDTLAFVPSAAYARFRWAEAALGAGDAGTAERELRAAWDAADGLGAAPLAGAVERLARRARIDVGAPAAEAAPGAGGSPLTPREAEVLALVAEGRTNRQIGEALFISEKTASVHVSRLLAKLGASNRAEAAAAARRAGLLGD
ncbi:MAG TPA: AAA family ATPase [Acidimicrobiales bacterium]|nr:AAA family ATPase [Acidimicrobiales bacterium]